MYAQLEYQIVTPNMKKDNYFYSAWMNVLDSNVHLRMINLTCEVFTFYYIRKFTVKKSNLCSPSSLTCHMEQLK